MANDSGVSSQCISCYWYVGNIGRDLACFAYPEGIPNDIFTGSVDHRLPQRGDHGLRWRENPEYTAILNEVMER